MKAPVILALVTCLLAGCGSDAKPPGPDVRGQSLPAAEQTLKKAGIAYSVKAEDGLFGVLVEQDWQVCSESKVNDHDVTLHVKKHGC